MSQSVATLNSLMKYVVPDKAVSLIPDNVKLYPMLPEIGKAQQAGRKLLVAVELTSEGGVTYGDGTAFAYESTVDGIWGEAQLDAYPVVLNMELSRSSVDRLADNADAFTDLATLKTKSMYTELARRAETSLFYGKSPTGIGTVGATTGTATTSLVVTFTTGQWAPGIWAGRKGHRFEFRQVSTGVGRAGHTTNLLVLSAVDFVNKKCTFVGNATEIATVVATDVCYFRGAYANDMVGLDAIMTTDGTIFNIDNTVYDLWKGNRTTLAANTMAEYIKAIGIPVAVGGLGTDTHTWINSTKFEALNSSITNQNYRGTGDKPDSKIEIGHDSLVFTTQAGKTTIKASPYVKEGDSFTFSLKDLKLFGAKKISFESTKGKGDYWLELPSNYGARMQGAYELAIMLGRPAQSIKATVP